MKNWLLYSSMGAFIGACLFFLIALFFPQAIPMQQAGKIIERAVPLIKLPPVDEQYPALNTASLKGSIQLVNFFASWCPPCRVEHPILFDLSKTLNAPIHGIAFKDQDHQTLKYLKEYGNPYKTVSKDSDQVAIGFGLYGLPETFVIDSKGFIRYHHRGPITKRDIDLVLVPLVKKIRAEN